MAVIARNGSEGVWDAVCDISGADGVVVVLFHSVIFRDTSPRGVQVLVSL